MDSLKELRVIATFVLVAIVGGVNDLAGILHDDPRKVAVITILAGMAVSIHIAFVWAFVREDVWRCLFPPPLSERT